MMITKIFFLFLLAFLTSCALDIDYHMPANRFDSPEVSGHFLGGKVEVNMASTHKVTLGEVYEDIFFNSGSHSIDSQYIDSSVTFNLAGDLGLLPRLDIFYRALYDSTDIVGFKFQFLGKGRNAKEKGWKAALSLGYGSEELDDDDLTITNSDNGATKTISSKLSTKAYDASLMFGHRFTPSILLYLNNYFTHYEVDGYILDQDGTSLSANGISHNYGSLLGVRLGEDAYFVLEGGFSRGDYESVANNLWSIGFSSGYSW